MWNASLTPSLTQTKGLYPLTTRIAYDRCDYSPHDVEDGEELSKRRHNEDLEAYELRKAAWIRLSTPFILPEPGEFSPPPKLRAMDLQKQFKSLQVIVKLANIELTPDKPEYVGGSWHVEGQLVNLHLQLMCIPLTRCYHRTSASAPPQYTITHAQT